MELRRSDPRPKRPCNNRLRHWARGIALVLTIGLAGFGTATIALSDDGGVVTVASTDSSPNSTTAASATHLRVEAGSPQTAGSEFSVTVTALDASDNTVTGYTGTVSFTSTDGAATLPADYTFTANDRGSKPFSVTLNHSG